MDDQNFFDDLLEIKEELIIKSEDPLDTDVLEGSSIHSCDESQNEADCAVHDRNAFACEKKEPVTATTTTNSATIEHVKNDEVVLAKNAFNQKQLPTVPETCNHECGICHMKFTNIVALCKHFVICKSPTNQKVHACPFCNKLYQRLHYLGRHLEKHFQKSRSAFTPHKVVLSKSTSLIFNSNGQLSLAPIEAERPQQIEHEEEIILVDPLELKEEKPIKVNEPLGSAYAVQIVSGQLVQVEEIPAIKDKDQPPSQGSAYAVQIVSGQLVQIEEIPAIKDKDQPTSQEPKEEIVLTDPLELKEEKAIKAKDPPISKESEDAVQGDLCMQLEEEKTVIEDKNQPISQDSAVLEGSIDSCDLTLIEPYSVPETRFIGNKLCFNQPVIAPTIQQIKRTYSRTKTISTKQCQQPEQGSDQNLSGMKTTPKLITIEKLTNDKHLARIDAYNKKLLETVPDKYSECEVCHKMLINKAALTNHILLNHTTQLCTVCNKEFNVRYFVQHVYKHGVLATIDLPPTTTTDAESSKEKEPEGIAIPAEPLVLQKEKTIKEKNPPARKEPEGAAQIAGDLIKQLEERIVIEDKDRPPRHDSKVLENSIQSWDSSQNTPDCVVTDDQSVAAPKTQIKKTYSRSKTAAIKPEPRAPAMKLCQITEQVPDQNTLCTSTTISLSPSSPTEADWPQQIESDVLTFDDTKLEETPVKPSDPQPTSQKFESRLFFDDLFEVEEEQINLEVVPARKEPAIEVRCCSSQLNCDSSQVKRSGVVVKIPVGQWPHRCSKCGKCFESDTSVKKHMKKHINVKPNQRLNAKKSKSRVNVSKKLKTNKVKSIVRKLITKNHKVSDSVAQNVQKEEYQPTKAMQLNEPLKIIPPSHFGEKNIKITESQSKELTKVLVPKPSSPTLQEAAKHCFVEPPLSSKIKGECDIIRVGETVNIITEVFHCEFCPSVFKSEKLFIKHVAKHYAPAKRSVCLVCGKNFKGLLYLKKHMKVHTRRKLCCTFCEKTFNLEKAFNNHMLGHMGKIVCKYCNKPFENKYKLNNHVKVVHCKRFQCKTCFKFFGLKQSLEEHKAIHRKTRPFNCGICKKSFITKLRLKSHTDSHFKKYLCKYCGKCFTASTYCKRHEMEHETNSAQFMCDVCGRVFKFMINLKRHIKLHSEKTHQCKFCPKKFATNGYLKKHIMVVHYYLVKQGAKPHVCCVCNKDFLYLFDLSRHQKLAHTEQGKKRQCNSAYKNEKGKQCNSNTKEYRVDDYKEYGPDWELRYRCPLCRTAFTKKILFERHMRRYSRKYKCTECGKVCLSKYSLRSHMNIHSKRFSCQFCNKNCGNKALLEVHKRIHTGERPFVCNLCDKRFKQTSHLKAHLAFHNEKTFICDICGARFYMKRDLANHIERHSASEFQ